MDNNPINKLDFGQKEAVLAQNNHILCLAGAGSGKTRVLTTRIYYLINKRHINPKSILSITFTKNAATEMIERLEDLGIKSEEIWCRTFHSACYRILKECKNTPNTKIIDDTKQSQIFEYCINSLNSSKELGYKLSRFLEENNWPKYLFSEEIVKIIHECKNYSLEPKDIAQKCRKEKNEDIKEFYRLFYVIFLTYQNYLQNNNLSDFSDLIQDAISLFKSDKKYLAHYQEKFSHILVDEFQDTNHSQIELLSLLVGNKNNLFVVGDDWQAIYGWRGGDVKYILNFKKTYRHSKTITLPYNYRSDGNIVYAANKCICKNKSQCRKKIKPFNPRRVKIKVFKGGDEKENFKFIKKSILKLIGHGIMQKNIMILGRNWKNVDLYLKKLPKVGFSDVQISTMHGAKGLESDIVFIVGLHKGRGGFPCIKDDNEILKVIKKTPFSQRLDEERRCFYVALTRAKKLLFLISEKGNESEFIKEIPKRFIEEIT
jgi:DNA helicase-4